MKFNKLYNLKILWDHFFPNVKICYCIQIFKITQYSNTYPPTTSHKTKPRPLISTFYNQLSSSYSLLKMFSNLHNCVKIGNLNLAFFFFNAKNVNLECFE